MRTICWRRGGVLLSATTLLLSACNGASPNAVPKGASLSLPAVNSVLSVDKGSKCRFGKIHVYNGPSGGGGALQVIADKKGNVWYGSIGPNAIVKFRNTSGVGYAIPSANAKPEGIAIDAHGKIWFTEWNLPKLGRVSPKGAMREFPIAQFGTGASQAIDMILGPDKRLWFTTDAKGIGARSLSGSTVLYSITNNAEQPTKLAVGPDGNLWFTEFNGPNIGKMTKSGAVTEYNVGGGANNYGIVAGPDGRMWFTDSANHRIGAIKTDGTGLTYYPVGSGSPAEIAVRAEDGKLYFTEWEGFIGQISTHGRVRLCAIPATPTFVAFGITENRRDRGMWFVDNSGSVDRIGELVVR